MSYREAACCSNVVFNAIAGRATLEALHSIGERYLADKTLVDVSNPLDFLDATPPLLFVTRE